MELHSVQIKRIIGPTPNGAAVLLGNDEKTFVIFVGFYEAAALIREINNETPARPLTHELIQNIFLGFEIEVKQIVVSAIIDQTFCATLILQQKIHDEEAGGGWSGRRNEVRIDARPSDCLVLALKSKVDILVTDEVFREVQDVSKMTADVEKSLSESLPGVESLPDVEAFRPPEGVGPEVDLSLESEGEVGGWEPDDDLLDDSDDDLEI